MSGRLAENHANPLLYSFAESHSAPIRQLIPSNRLHLSRRPQLSNCDYRRNAATNSTFHYADQLFPPNANPITRPPK